ncbi:MAG TPA: hypothetical protein VM241_08190 [Candidatus Thermoplasmatota archaeon]|nr:hypothetical protein [Candidatus Thermoplasmatota archaeon]
MRPALLVLAGLLLAGCSTPPGHFQALAVQFANGGETLLGVPVTVTAPDGTILLQATVQVPGGGAVVEKRVAAAQAGTYTIFADYSHEQRQGSSVQKITSSQRHTLQSTDCATPVAAVLFTFRNTSTPATQQFRNSGSQGSCLAA